MAFGPNELDSKNSPMRWRIQGRRIAEGGAEGATEAAKLDTIYQSVLAKAATFTSDAEMGIGNQPGVGSEPDPVLITGISITQQDGSAIPATIEFNGVAASNNELNIKAVVTPADADNASVIFSSSSNTIDVTSTYGLATINDPGTDASENVIITATAQDGSGVIGTVAITVTNTVVES